MMMVIIVQLLTDRHEIASWLARSIAHGRELDCCWLTHATRARFLPKKLLPNLSRRDATEPRIENSGLHMDDVDT